MNVFKFMMFLTKQKHIRRIMAIALHIMKRLNLIIAVQMFPTKNFNK